MTSVGLPPPRLHNALTEKGFFSHAFPSVLVCVGHGTLVKLIENGFEQAAAGWVQHYQSCCYIVILRWSLNIFSSADLHGMLYDKLSLIKHFL